jgi:hypothetical protein
MYVHHDGHLLVRARVDHGFKNLSEINHHPAKRLHQLCINLRLRLSCHDVLGARANYRGTRLFRYLANQKRLDKAQAKYLSHERKK